MQLQSSSNQQKLGACFLPFSSAAYMWKHHAVDAAGHTSPGHNYTQSAEGQLEKLTNVDQKKCRDGYYSGLIQ